MLRKEKHRSALSLQRKGLLKHVIYRLLQRKKLRHRHAQQFSLSHTASTWLSWTSHPNLCVFACSFIFAALSSPQLLSLPTPHSPFRSLSPMPVRCFCNLAMLFCFYGPALNFHGFCMDCCHNLAASLFTVHSVTHGFLKFTSDYVTSLLKSFDFSLNIK